MDWRYRLSALFNVRLEEGRLVALLLLYSFCLGIPQVFTETVGNTLFLITFDARAMAYVYIGFAIIVPITGLAYSWLEARLSLTRLLTANLGLLLVSLCALWLILGANLGSWPIVGAAIWGEVVWVLTSLAFGGLIGQLFTVRQGKRLFGLVGSGEVIAGIMGGFSVPLLVNWLGTTNLLLVAAAGVACALALIPAIMRAGSLSLDAHQEDSDGSSAGPQPPLFKNRYIVLIFAFAALSLFGYFFLDNIFYIALESHYPDEEQLAGFLGLFYATVGLLTLMGRSLIAARLFTRYGVLGGLLAVPVAIALGALPVLLVGHFFAVAPLLFWLIVATKLLNDVFKDAIDQPVSLILYQILPLAQRIRAQTVVESMVEPIASGLAGTALLILASLLGLGTNGLVLILLGILIIWSIVAVLLSRMYGGVLLQALTKRRLGGTTLLLNDGSSRAVVQRLLVSSHPDEVIYALNVLQESQADLPPLLLNLLEHPQARVRLEALRRIEQAGGNAALGRIQRLIETEPVLAVRSMALRTLTILGGSEVFDQVIPYLDDPDPQIRREVGVGLLRSGEIEGVLAAGERLITLVRSPAPDQRVIAAHMLGEVGNSNFYRPLYLLLADQHQQVREAALRAAGQLGSPRLWPLVIAGLASAETGAAATTALVQGGGTALPALMQAFMQPGQAPALYIRIARICGRIRSAEAARLLIEHVEHPHPDVRLQVLIDLQRCGFAATGEYAVQIGRLIRGEAQRAADLLAGLADVGEHAALMPLQSVLHYQVGRCRERIFWALGLLYDRHTILRARDSIVSRLAQQRAYGFEVLDMTLSSQLKPLVLPLCDEQTPQIQLQQLGAVVSVASLGRTQRLQALSVTAGEAHHWIRTCARYALHQLGLKPEGDPSMITLIEKVVLLKTVSIFAEAPDEILADVAAILEDQLVSAEQLIFAKGDPGRCLYIVATGRLRAHDGDRLLNYLEERDVFGEMAVLGSGLRAASVTAVEDCRLLRLDQEALYELMADRVEVARGIIHVLLNRLNDRMQDVGELRSRVQQLSEEPGARSQEPGARSQESGVRSQNK